MNLDNSMSGQEKSPEPELTSIAELCDQLLISQKTAYKRMRFLQIKSWKHGKRSFLDREQVRYMNELHRHHQETGGFNGFPIPKPTGPRKETEPLQQESELAIRKIEESSHPWAVAAMPIEMVEESHNLLEEKFKQEDLTTSVEDIEKVEQPLLPDQLTEKFTINGFNEKVEASKERCSAAPNHREASLLNFFDQRITQLISRRKRSIA